MKFQEFNRSKEGNVTVLTTRESEVRDLFRTPYSRRKCPVDPLFSGTGVYTKSKPSTSSPATFMSKSGMTYVRDLRSMYGYNTKGFAEASQDETWMVAGRNRTLAKAKHSAVNLAVCLAEYRQTGNLFADVARDVARLTRAALTRNPKLLLPRRRWDKSTSERWLQYTYGIKPLMSDVVGSWEALNTATARPLIQQYRAVCRENRKVVDFFDAELLLGPLSGSRRVSRVSETKLRGVTHTVVRFKNEALHRYVGQFGFTNPASVAWEVIPFSFVSDWFINFGEFFASLDNYLIMDDVRVGFYTKSELLVNVNGGGGGFSAFHQYIARKPLAKTTSVATVSYEPSATLRRITSGLALLHQGAWRRGFR